MAININKNGLSLVQTIEGSPGRKTLRVATVEKRNIHRRIAI